MPLYEHPERRYRQPMGTQYWTGWDHYRYMVCAFGELDTHLTESLELGKPMIALWGGDGSSSADKALLQSVEIKFQSDGAFKELQCVFRELNTFGAYTSNYIETDKSRVTVDGQHTQDIITYGVDSSASGTGVPDVGDAIDGGPTTSVDTAICYRVQEIPVAEHGRVLFEGHWRGLKAYQSRDSGGDY